MAMTVSGGKAGPVANLNVTPLIDVLLVLLIIFMVITPLVPKGLDAATPAPSERGQRMQNPGTAVVVSVDSQHHLKINQEPISLEDLGPRLTDIFKTRSERVMFVKGDPEVSFGDVARVIDIAKGAGVDQIGLITKAIKEGS